MIIVQAKFSPLQVLILPEESYFTDHLVQVSRLFLAIFASFPPLFFPFFASIYHLVQVRPCWSKQSQIVPLPIS